MKTEDGGDAMRIFLLCSVGSLKNMDRAQSGATEVDTTILVQLLPKRLYLNRLVMSSVPVSVLSINYRAYSIDYTTIEQKKVLLSRFVKTILSKKLC